jgi:hypothetical protein
MNTTLLSFLLITGVVKLAKLTEREPLVLGSPSVLLLGLARRHHLDEAFDREYADSGVDGGDHQSTGEKCLERQSCRFFVHFVDGVVSLLRAFPYGLDVVGS